MDAKDDAARKQRALQRRTWPVRKGRLQDIPEDNLMASTTPEERLAMVWELTLEAWAVAGLPIPDYAREQAPVRCFRRTAS